MTTKFNKTFFFKTFLFLVSGLAFASDYDVQDILSAMSEKWSEVDDFTCRMESYVKLGKKEQKQIMNYYFMKPNWIRLEIIGGDNTGAKIVYNPIEKMVRAKAGGILGVVAFKFSPDNPRVQSIRGHRIDNNNIGYIISRWREYLKRCKISVSFGDSTITLEATGVDTSKYNGTYSEKLVIDSKTDLPIYFEQFDMSGELIHRVFISDIKINVGLRRNFFNL